MNHPIHFIIIFLHNKKYIKTVIKKKNIWLKLLGRYGPPVKRIFAFLKKLILEFPTKCSIGPTYSSFTRQVFSPIFEVKNCSVFYRPIPSTRQQAYDP